MGLPEVLISTLGNLISALAELVGVISGDIISLKMSWTPSKVMEVLGEQSSPKCYPVSQTLTSIGGNSKCLSQSEKSLAIQDTNIYKNPDIKLTVPEIIQKYGFPFESHQVLTKDKYILTLFRVPHGRHGRSLQTRPPVLLVHGLLNSAGAWIMHDSKKALAYKLAEAGFDCWMANCRGSTFSRSHETLTLNNKKFWDFSFHEMGQYDVPAIINYILERTSQPSLSYIGHSLGNNMLMVAMSEDRTINEKIKLVVCLAPAVYLYKTTATLLSTPAPLISQQKSFLDYFTGNGELMSKTFLDQIKGLYIVPKPEYWACKCVTASMYTMGGYNADQIYWPQLPVIAAHTPASTSVKTYAHCAQYFIYSEFQQYDYGSSSENIKVYGEGKPPKYDLNKVTSPVAIFWGANDMLCRPETVDRLAKELPNVIGNYRVDCDNFSHTDFLYAKDVDILVYDKVIDLLKCYR